MRLFFGWAILASTALAVVACSAGADSDRSDGEGGEAGDREAGGRTSSGGSSGRTGDAGKGANSSAGSSVSGTGSSVAGSGAPAGSGGLGSSVGGTEAGAAGAFAETGGAGGADDAPTRNRGESCTAPCELTLGPTDNLPGDSAVVLYDFETNVATLTSDPVANAESEWVIGFSYEADPQRGYRAWSTYDWWFAFTEPLEYVEGTTGMKQYVEVTTEMVSPATSRILRIVYSFGDHTVNIHSIVVPDCDSAQSGACASPDDCSLVDAGMLRTAASKCNGTCAGDQSCIAGCMSEGEELSLGCSECYAAFLGCVTAGCPTECPGQGGGDCMACETSAGCHTAFMECSGLDYMPRGTLTWPLGPIAR
jgi:hypothetical protein